MHWLPVVRHGVMHIWLVVWHSMLELHRRVVDLLLTGRWHEVAMLSMVWIIGWLVDKPRRLVLLHRVSAFRFDPVAFCEMVNLAYQICSRRLAVTCASQVV